MANEREREQHQGQRAQGPEDVKGTSATDRRSARERPPWITRGSARGLQHPDQPHVGTLQARMIFALKVNDHTASSIGG